MQLGRKLRELASKTADVFQSAPTAFTLTTTAAATLAIGAFAPEMASNIASPDALATTGIGLGIASAISLASKTEGPIKNLVDKLRGKTMLDNLKDGIEKLGPDASNKEILAHIGEQLKNSGIEDKRNFMGSNKMQDLYESARKDSGTSYTQDAAATAHANGDQEKVNSFLIATAIEDFRNESKGFDVQRSRTQEFVLG